MILFHLFFTFTKKDMILTNIKEDILLKLSEKSESDPIFETIQNILYRFERETESESWLDQAIRKIKARGDTDVQNSQIVTWFADLFDAIGYRENAYKTVDEFLNLYESGESILDLDSLIPEDGTAVTEISNIWRSDLSEDLKELLHIIYDHSYNLKISKTDAGPGEIFMAIMDRGVGFQPDGDIIVNGKRIEVKSSGGRMHDLKAFESIPEKLKFPLYQKYLALFEVIGPDDYSEDKKFKYGQELNVGVQRWKYLFNERMAIPESVFDKVKNPKPGRKYFFDSNFTRVEHYAKNIFGSLEYLGSSGVKVSEVGITINSMTSPKLVDAKFKELCARAFRIILHKDDVSELTEAIGTESFKFYWLNEIVKRYNQVKNFDGILYLTKNSYAYFPVDQEHGVVNLNDLLDCVDLKYLFNFTGQPRAAFPSLL